MKHNGIFIALSAAALFAAGTISAEAQAGFPGVHGGSGAYRAGGHGGGGGFNGAGRGFHAGGGGFHGGGIHTGMGGGGRNYGGYGRGVGYGLAGAALGYGLAGGYGSYYGDDYGYGDPSYAYGSGDYGYDGGAYAYDPQYSGGGSPKHPDFTFNPGSEQTYAYISNILHEVNVLFPGKMIHIGGDEVSFGRDNWNQLSGIKTFMDANHLSTLDEVENYFTHRISDTLQNWGTLTGVWDEAVNAHLPAKQTTIFWWRQNHPEQLKTALALGYHIVLCPRLPMYFDFVQLKTDQLGRKWDNGEFNALADVYAFPQSLKLPESEDTKNIDGIQANLWTETVISTQRADYLLFPRIAALAEAAWTAAGQKDYTHFLGRLQSEYLMYLKAGIYYCPADSAVYHPEPAR